MDRRKELKLAYKQNPPPMGVYQVKNIMNGKVLIGSALNLPGKKNSFQLQLNLKSHPNKALQEDFIQYGPEAFTFEFLEVLKPESLAEENPRQALAALEEKWLTKLQPYAERGYNRLKNKQWPNCT